MRYLIQAGVLFRPIVPQLVVGLAGPVCVNARQLIDEGYLQK
jgi:hypothetical protein